MRMSININKITNNPATINYSCKWNSRDDLSKNTCSRN